MIRELVNDDELLSTPCEPATADDAELAQDLLDTLESIEDAACLAANQIGGILLLFLVTLLMGYASGCIVPSAYLPKAVRSVGRHLPTATMLHVSVGGLTQIADKAGTWLVLAEAATGFAVTAALMKWNRWRAQR